MEKRSEDGKIYYAKLKDDGLVNFPSINVLQVVVGDSIHFQLNCSSPIANKAHLLVNQPGSDFKNRIMTPLISITKDFKDNAVANDIKEKLTSYDPINESPNTIEFQVAFKYPGNFFYQIEYFDESLSGTNYTKADWILVHPYLLSSSKSFSLESLTIQTNMGRCLGKFKDWEKMLALSLF